MPTTIDLLNQIEREAASTPATVCAWPRCERVSRLRRTMRGTMPERHCSSSNIGCTERAAEVLPHRRRLRISLRGSGCTNRSKWLREGRGAALQAS